jgi:hypothetical protein
MTMADKVLAKNSDKAFQPHPKGSEFIGQCVDVIDMGEELSEFPGKAPKLMPKVAFVWRTGEMNEDGQLIDLVAEFTNSLGDLANLRAFLEQWRGDPLTPQQIEEGVPLEKMEGKWALLGVGHKTSKKGRTYAIITSATQVPRVMRSSLPEFPAYTRPKYLVDKKEKNVAAAAEYRKKIGAPAKGFDGGDPGPQEPEDGFLEPPVGVADDDLPF